MTLDERLRGRRFSDASKDALLGAMPTLSAGPEVGVRPSSTASADSPEADTAAADTAGVGARGVGAGGVGAGGGAGSEEGAGPAPAAAGAATATGFAGGLLAAGIVRRTTRGRKLARDGGISALAILGPTAGDTSSTGSPELGFRWFSVFTMSILAPSYAATVVVTPPKRVHRMP